MSINNINLFTVREGMSEAISSAIKIHSAFSVLNAAMLGRDDQDNSYKHRVSDQEFISVLEVFADQAEELTVLLDRVQCDYDRLIESLGVEAQGFQGGDK